MEKHCSKCGLTVNPDDKYCRFCGAQISLKAKLDDKINDLEDFLSEEIKKQLVSKGKLINLKKEKDKYLAELKRLEDDLTTGRSSLIEVEKKLNYYKEQIASIKQKEKRIDTKNLRMPYEEIIHKRERLNEQMRKLDVLLESGKINERNYHVLRSELLSKFNSFNEDFENIKSKMRKLYMKLRDEVDNLDRELEVLAARFEVGQLDKSDYYEKEKELKNKINDYKLCLEALKNEPSLLPK